MEKNKISFWSVTIIFFFCFSTVLAKDKKNEISLIGKEGYIDFVQLKAAFGDLRFHLNFVTLIGTITNKKKKISKTDRFTEIKTRIDSFYFSVNDSIERMSSPILYKKNKVLLPPELVEAIFIYLLDYNIDYQFTRNKLVFKPVEAITPAEEINLKYVIIDAGHGGKDPGTIAINGTFEKTINLQVAIMLKKYLKKKFPGLVIKLTRKDDTFISLEERSEFANRYVSAKRGHTIYISLHCNNGLRKGIHGYEIYYLYQNATIEIARQHSIVNQNLIESKPISSKLKWIQSDMMSSAVQRNSIRLAEAIDENMKDNVGNKIVSRGIKKARFNVLRNSLMPAVLVEMGYTDHEQDIKNLENKKVQKKIIKGIAEGIKKYVYAKDPKF
ncbi:MAG: N-acetylmuramoyl-L-alanine amidase [Leptospiraceae bacterium]|nr:N-acetylmuramoyl-L-alanine amidase [Leptospiraceae bacterium]MCP5495886.1 N-acetylmuramoyl-L-alanine amidase [Leptospiraceae bacterium]